MKNGKKYFALTERKKETDLYIFSRVYRRKEKVSNERVKSFLWSKLFPTGFLLLFYLILNISMKSKEIPLLKSPPIVKYQRRKSIK
jgi:hypothetical protein